MDWYRAPVAVTLKIALVVSLATVGAMAVGATTVAASIDWWMWYAVHAAVVGLATGIVIYFWIVKPFISAQQKARKSFRTSEEQMHAIFDHAPVSIFLKDADSRFLRVNGAYARHHGIDPESVAGKDGTEWLGEDSVETVLEQDRAVIDQRKSFEQDLEIKDKDGEIRFLRTVKFPLVDRNGTVVGVGGITQDRTRQERTERALWERDARLRGILENAPDGIVTIDENGAIESANPAVCTMFGYEENELLGQNANILTPKPSDDDSAPDLTSYVFGKTNDGQIRQPHIVNARRKDGSVLPTALAVDDMMLGERRLFIATLRDVSHYVAMQDMLSESETRYRELFENTPEAIFVRVDDKIVFVNPEVLSLFGAQSGSDLIGKMASTLYHPDDVPRLLKARETVQKAGRTDGFNEYRSLRLDGSMFYSEAAAVALQWNGEPAKLVIIRDITARKENEAERAKLEQQLRQLQKMESLGTLAGGIAHELNNMLVPILGLTEVTMGQLEEVSRAHSNLSAVHKSAKRASELVEKILGFSHRDDATTAEIDLRTVVKEQVGLLRAMLPSTIEIEADLPPDPVVVLGDETQLHQVLMNLASNAAHAMGPNVGTLSLGLRDVEIADPREARRAGGACGPYAKLSVRDTGSGMDEATLARIFDPFFTTKPVGEGTGMGLALIHSIVSAHGGSIDVTSAPGEGTTFDVYLPLALGNRLALPASA